MNVDTNCAGQTAIVTGSASGIGAATVLALARQGYRTAGIDIDLAGAQAVATEASTINRLEHLAIAADVSDEAALVAAFEQAFASLGRLPRVGQAGWPVLAGLE